MKLTDSTKLRIRNRIISDAFDNKEKAYRELLRVAVIEQLKKSGTLTLDEILAKYPDIQKYIKITNEVIVYYQLKSEYCTLQQTVESVEPLLLEADSDYLEINITKKEDPALFKLLLAGDKLKTDKKIAEKALRLFLDSVHTTKQLLDAKPEFAKYVPNEKQKTQIYYPIVSMETLNSIDATLKMAAQNKVEEIKNVE